MADFQHAMQEPAEPNPKARGAIVALEDEQQMLRALAVSPSIEFHRHQITFKLIKV